MFSVCAAGATTVQLKNFYFSEVFSLVFNNEMEFNVSVHLKSNVWHYCCAAAADITDN